MELSGIELHYLVNKISSKITSSYYVSNISSITKNSILLKLHHPTESDINLIVSTKGIWITSKKYKQMEENQLLSILSREIERAKINSVSQPGSERIFFLHFINKDNKERKLVVEIFGKGNIILCDESMKILWILNPVEVRHRILKTGLEYVLPPNRGEDVFQISLEGMKKSRDMQPENTDLVRWLAKCTSLPRKYVEEILLHSGNSAKYANNLSDNDVRDIYYKTKEITRKVIDETNHEPSIMVDKLGLAIDASPIVMSGGSNAKKVESYMDGIDQVLSNEIISIGRSLKTEETDRKILELEHDLEEQNKAKTQVITRSQNLRRVAHELMNLSSRGVEDMYDSTVRSLLENNDSKIVKENGITYLNIENERIKFESSIPKSSSLLFSRAKELERGAINIDKASEELRLRVEKLQNQTQKIHEKIQFSKLESKQWYERYRWFVTSDGYLVIGGRDASSNSAIIRKYMTENDIIFHAEIHGSPFFLVKNVNNQEKQDSSYVEEAAQATVSFSRAWKDGLSSGDAYWVFPNQVKKGAPTGQFLPKGSFVIEGKRNFCRGIELKLSIGLVQIEKKYSIVCGPLNAVRKRSLVFTSLLPGGTDPMNLAKKVKSEFVRAISEFDQSLAEYCKKISLDEFIRMLPTGQSKIERAERGQAINNTINE
ncbi:MAG: ribosome rescue protein RqcH [Nitrososphaeraceae archaeon]|nr:ribosome rescue protein RqcH [Nitrososphaeraceae archaeon]MDW0172365.1 ribosome rescue protein RqcH [Nitrososphaeraceae archaeon]MDW0180143.1 ribosome rescue protein RqcH [Nitrososphaeraceae archaeon]MDW0183796.1 ribosome rescue protein RqcH [Nitrososphaeraceae archaeon]MDW0188857.1 ribosome rescue protein RqcH [Nitrososphaeraceae archaeon]